MAVCSSNKGQSLKEEFTSGLFYMRIYASNQSPYRRATGLLQVGRWCIVERREGYDFTSKQINLFLVKRNCTCRTAALSNY